MLYCIIMKGSRTNSKYKDSHKKSEAKHLTRSSVPDTIFVDKRQATSDKRQATKRHKRAVCPNKNTPKQHTFFSKQPWFGKGAATPLSPRLFVGGKRDTCQTQVSLFPPTAPYLLFNAAKGDTPLETPSVYRKAYKQRFPKSCGSLKTYTPYKFAFIASSLLDWNQKRTGCPLVPRLTSFLRSKNSKPKNVQGRTFLGGGHRGASFFSR